jgi:hypothetical protein
MNDAAEAVRVLLAAGADPRAGDQDGETAEEGARRRGRRAAADLLAASRNGSRGSPRATLLEVAPSDARGRAAARALLARLDDARRAWVPPPAPAPAPAPAAPAPAAPAAAAAESSSEEEDAGAMAARVEGLRTKGNQCFGRKDYSAAIAAYSVAVPGPHPPAPASALSARARRAKLLCAPAARRASRPAP